MCVGLKDVQLQLTHVDQAGREDAAGERLYEPHDRYVPGAFCVTLVHVVGTNLANASSWEGTQLCAAMISVVMLSACLVALFGYHASAMRSAMLRPLSWGAAS